MPRDVNGVYTLPPGNPVIPNTIIATNWANTTMDDIAAALTASLSIDGSVTTAKIANLAVTTAKIANGAVTLSKLSTDVARGVSSLNYIVNSGLQVWQADTSLPAGTGARDAADGFRHVSVGTTYSVTQQTWVPGGSPASNTNSYFNVRTVTSSVAGAANLCVINIPIENVNTLNNTQVTFSMFARANTSLNIAIEFLQVFGTGGSPSTIVSVPAGLVALTTSLNRVSVTATLPSTLGKTLGSNNDDHIKVVIWLDAGSNFNTRASNLGQQSGTFDFWGLKLEAGSAPSTYEMPDYNTEFMRCLRYFQKLQTTGGVGPILFSGNVTTANAYSCIHVYPAPMRVVPSTTYVNGGVDSSFPAAATVGSVLPTSLRVFKTANATGVGVYSGRIELDARYT